MNVLGICPHCSKEINLHDLQNLLNGVNWTDNNIVNISFNIDFGNGKSISFKNNKLNIEGVKI